MTWPVMFPFVPWHSSWAFCTTVLCTGSGLRRELPLPAAASSAWNAGLLPITTKQMPRAKGWESDRPMSPPLPFSCAHCVTSNNHWASQKPFPPSASGAGDIPILQDGSWRLHKDIKSGPVTTPMFLGSVFESTVNAHDSNLNNISNNRSPLHSIPQMKFPYQGLYFFSPSFCASLWSYYTQMVVYKHSHWHSSSLTS